jgi:polyisoprenoid-binding protein YceI
LRLLAAGFGLATPVAYEILRAARGLVKLTVEKTGLLSGKKHLFTFAQYQGTLLIDRDAPERSAIAITIDSRSISCHDTWLSAKDLRKVQDYALKDMLAADRYPRITFQSTRLRRSTRLSTKYEEH